MARQPGWWKVWWFEALLVSMTACSPLSGGAEPRLTPALPPQPVSTEAQPVIPDQAVTALPTVSQAFATTEPLPTGDWYPPEPVEVRFQAVDGTPLVGTYYPSSRNPAPLVVLMHWAGGDQQDWLFLGMTAWLQNRNQLPYEPDHVYRFDTPYAFPPLPEGRSYAVFTFDFRGFGQSPGPELSFEQKRPLWLLDAQAAYATARGLPGVDSGQMIGIGASLGADAVVEACGELCAGALSLGPGDYLGVSYAEAAKELLGRGVQVWCVAAQDDPPAQRACERVGEAPGYLRVVYPSGGHAMTLFRSRLGLEPPLGQVVLDALQAWAR